MDMRLYGPMCFLPLVCVGDGDCVRPSIDGPTVSFIRCVRTAHNKGRVVRTTIIQQQACLHSSTYDERAIYQDTCRTRREELSVVEFATSKSKRNQS